MTTSPTVQKIDPVWGVTLKPGYCGFITREKDFVGDGIAWFERYEDSGGLPFCHALALTGALAGTSKDCAVIEAHARTGVHQAQLSEYFGDLSCQLFVRIPKNYGAMGSLIVNGMVSQLGDKYGYGLIVADLLENTFAGHLLNKCTGNVPDKIVRGIFSDQHTRICSQAVASAYQKALAQVQVQPTGCLKQAADTIDPKLLGNDPEIWEPVIYQVTYTP